MNNLDTYKRLVKLLYLLNSEHVDSERTYQSLTDWLDELFGSLSSFEKEEANKYSEKIGEVVDV